MSKPNYSREVELDLLETFDEEHTGHLKTEQKPSERHHEVSKISISVRRLVEAHGLYDTVKSIPASLIVLRFKITSKDHNLRRRVTSLTLELRFEKLPKGEQYFDPFLGAFAPAMQGDVYIRPSQEKRTAGSETGVEASLNAPNPVPGSLAVHKNWTTGREWTKDFISKISGDSKKSLPSKGQRQGDDMMWWHIGENGSQEDGIADTFAVAVLVKRDEQHNFQLHLSLDVKVDMWYDVAKLWQKMIGKRYEPLGFNTATEPHEEDGFPDGHDRNTLREFTDKNLLDGLAFVHLPEELKTAKFYQKEL